MAKIISLLSGKRGIVRKLLFAVSAVLSAAVLAWAVQYGLMEKLAGMFTSAPSVVESQPGITKLPSVVGPNDAPLAGAGGPKIVIMNTNQTGTADSIEPRSIQVVDGDTILANGQTYRLVGFDAPESGMQARCESERTLAARATARLRQLVVGGALRLKRMPCACPLGTEGTKKCNYGRLCGVLTSQGRDVGAILIGEGLARSYICSGTRCPPRQKWC
jgi:endonuclease YncB( thermonuclease family)